MLGNHSSLITVQRYRSSMHTFLYNMLHENIIFKALHAHIRCLRLIVTLSAAFTGLTLWKIVIVLGQIFLILTNHETFIGSIYKLIKIPKRYVVAFLALERKSSALTWKMSFSLNFEILRLNIWGKMIKVWQFSVKW